MLLGEAGRLGDHAVQRFGPMVAQIGDHRHHRTVVVEQVGIVHRRLLRAIVQDVLVARQGQPLRAALVGAGGDLAHRVAEKDRRLDAGQLLQAPGQAIGLDQGLVVEAAFGRRLDDDRELVARQRVAAGNIGIVAVVARVGAQFRRPLFEIADLQLQADDEAGDRQDQRHDDGAQRPAPLGKTLESAPQCGEAAAAVIRFSAQATLGRGRADAGIGQQDRQQDQVGEDQHRDAEAGGQCQILDDRDVDHHQHGETDGIGEQRRHAGEEQAAEGVAGSDQPVRAAADVLHDAVHLLRPVRDADGKDQEGDEDRERVELEAEEGDQSELPDDGDHRARNDQRRAAQAAGVEIDDGDGDRGGDGEEGHHLGQAVDQVADQL